MSQLSTSKGVVTNGKLAGVPDGPWRDVLKKGSKFVAPFALPQKEKKKEQKQKHLEEGKIQQQIKEQPQ